MTAKAAVAVSSCLENNEEDKGDAQVTFVLVLSKNFSTKLQSWTDKNKSLLELTISLSLMCTHTHTHTKDQASAHICDNNPTAVISVNKSVHSYQD